nr:MAG TPA: hypothetical protein [Caudoviricetes sp.]
MTTNQKVASSNLVSCTNIKCTKSLLNQAFFF